MAVTDPAHQGRDFVRQTMILRAFVRSMIASGAREAAERLPMIAEHTIAYRS